MRSEIKLLVPCACAILLLYSGKDRAGTYRVLDTSDESRVYDETQLYNLSCPVSTTRWVSTGPHPVEANLYAVESGVLPIVHRAFQGKVNRKIVLTGDSNTRQIFMSIACLTHALGIWKDDDAYTAAFIRGEQNRMFNDARLMLKNDSGELFLSPTAGKVQSYGWTGENDAMEGNEDWLKSCHERKPFYLDTLSYYAPNQKVSFSPNDDMFEKVALDEEDVVFFNSGLHPSTRDQNRRNLLELLNCMQDAREKGYHVNWPRLYYVRSNVQHFGGANGLYRGNITKHLPCSERVDAQANPFVIQDKNLFTGKLPLVSFETDLSDLGHLHITGGKPDCSHWTMPGVPDVYARDVAKELLKLN